jgi:acetyl esterase/lipase
MDPEQGLGPAEAGPDLVLRYGDHPDAVIDVFLPSDAQGVPVPLVVFLHGGFWRQEWDRVPARPLAWGLVDAGYAVATPEYRRGSGSWPSMSVDVVASLVDVRGLIEAAAPGRIDVSAPFVLTGHSAGGHLALWSGLRAGPELVTRIVALAPVTDVEYAAWTGMGDGAAQDLLGGEPDEVPSRYAEADAARRLPGSVPVTLIQGDSDLQVPVEMNRRIAEGISPAPGDAAFQYVELPGVDHFALVDPQSDAWSTVLRALAASS